MLLERIHSQLLGVMWLKLYKHLGCRASQNFYYAPRNSKNEASWASRVPDAFDYRVLSWHPLTFCKPRVLRNAMLETSRLARILDLAKVEKNLSRPSFVTMISGIGALSSALVREDSLVNEEPKLTKNCDGTRNQQIWRTLTLEILNPVYKQHMCQLPEDLHI